MLERKAEISRREILKAGGLFVSSLVLQQIAEFGVNKYEQTVKDARYEMMAEWTPKQPLPGQIAIGFSPDQNTTVNGISIASALDVTPQCFNFFLNLETRGYIYEQIELAAKAGIIPVIWLGNYDGLGSKYEEFSPILDDAIGVINGFNIPCIFRPYAEINGSWSEDWWGKVEEKQFKDNWKKMYRQIKDSSDLIKVALCLNSTIYIDPFNKNPFDRWYTPYIDILAFDIYNKNSSSFADIEHYRSPDYPADAMIIPDIIHARETFGNIPIAITEFNCEKDNGKAQWLVSGMKIFSQLGVNLCMSFDWNQPKEDHNWNIKIYPQVMNAYRKLFKESCYITSNQDWVKKPHFAMAKICQLSV